MLINIFDLKATMFAERSTSVIGCKVSLINSARVMSYCTVHVHVCMQSEKTRREMNSIYTV